MNCPSFLHIWEVGTYIGQQTFLAVIDVGNGDFTLRNAVVIVDVVRQEAHFCMEKFCIKILVSTSHYSSAACLFSFLVDMFDMV